MAFARRLAGLLVVLAGWLQSAPGWAATVGTAAGLGFQLGGSLNFTGGFTFDSDTHDVFGTAVNLGTSVGDMELSGQITSASGRPGRATRGVGAASDIGTL